MDFTLGSMYWINPKYSLEDFREDMRRVRENRLTLLRIFIQWEYVEAEKNRFDFSVYDRFFQAAEESGIGVMPTLLFYLPLHRLIEQQENGRSDAGRRYPCLDRPEIREWVEKFFSETVLHYKDSPALKIWNLWNEPTDTQCRCPHSLEQFSLWLKKRYPTMDALREAWEGEYAVFKPVMPDSIEAMDACWLEKILSLPLRGRDTALQLDWLEFQSGHSAEHLAFLAGLVRRYDTLHPVHSNPACTTINPLRSGISPWKVAEVQDSTGGSIHPHYMLACLENSPERYPAAMLSVIDLVRSWTAGREAWIGEYQAGSTFGKHHAYTPAAADISVTLYHSLARGLRGVIFWEWQSWRSGIFEPGEFSLRNPSDGGPTERSEAAARFGKFLELHQPHLKKLRMPQPSVAIFHSFDQFAADELLARTSPSIPVQRHFQSSYACHQALAEAGIPCDFISEHQLDAQTLKSYRMLILPHVRLIAPETAEAIENFVRSGGAVWADGRCGLFDKHYYLRNTVPGNGLDRVFGCREIDEVAPRENDRLICQDGFSVTPYREIQRLKADAAAEILAWCNGYPAAVRNRYGKGIAELWGTYLSANPESDLSAFLPGFAAANGVLPEIRIKQGNEIVFSLLRGEGIMLAVFTSLAKKEQKVIIELPLESGRILNDVSADLSGRNVGFVIQKNETIPLLIETDMKLSSSGGLTGAACSATS